MDNAQVTQRDIDAWEIYGPKIFNCEMTGPEALARHRLERSEPVGWMPSRPSGYATLEEMRQWADQVMRRNPDFVIGNDYLRRWWIIPRNEGCNIYLHQIMHSDDDRALHDHPWGNTSYILSGGYIEHTPEGVFARKAGDIVERAAGALHRLEVTDGEPCVSLFITGPKVRDWGFQCPQGWVRWQDFTDPTDSSQTGRGCGEHDDPTPSAPGTTPPEPVAEIERLREALREISDLTGEINPSNYDHDDACELNRQFCYAITVADEALKGAS